MLEKSWKTSIYSARNYDAEERHKFILFRCVLGVFDEIAAVSKSTQGRAYIVLEKMQIYFVILIKLCLWNAYIRCCWAGFKIRQAESSARWHVSLLIIPHDLRRSPVIKEFIKFSRFNFPPEIAVVFTIHRSLRRNSVWRIIVMI